MSRIDFSLSNSKEIDEDWLCPCEHKQLRAGDVLTVWKPDRLGRSLKHLVELVQWLMQNKIELRSLEILTLFFSDLLP